MATAAHGQKALSEAHILLVAADGSGTEVANTTTVSECAWSSYDESSGESPSLPLTNAIQPPPLASPSLNTHPYNS